MKQNQNSSKLPLCTAIGSKSRGSLLSDWKHGWKKKFKKWGVNQEAKMNLASWFPLRLKRTPCESPKRFLLKDDVIINSASSVDCHQTVCNDAGQVQSCLSIKKQLCERRTDDRVGCTRSNHLRHPLPGHQAFSIATRWTDCFKINYQFHLVQNAYFKLGEAYKIWE